MLQNGQMDIAMSQFEKLKERTIKDSYKVTDLTSDCWYVTYINSKKEVLTDLVRCSTMGGVFDHYYDLGVQIKDISLARGHLNPKFYSPKLKQSLKIPRG